MREWIVILEATCTASSIDMEAVRRLVQAMAALQPGALYSVDRYALQLHVDANSPTQALATALHRWHDEVNQIDDGLAACALARAEVLTPEEYELEHCANGDRAPSAVHLVADHHMDDGEKLLRRALLDSVTGLPSRELFVDQVDRALIAGRRLGSRLAVLCVALDDLPAGSGQAGRSGRDEIRQRLATRITSGVRVTDTTARVGQNQFALLLEDTSAERAKTVATRLLEMMGEPLPSDDGVLVVSAVVGIAMSEAQGAAEELLGQAAHAATAARQPGHERMACFHALEEAPVVEKEKARSDVGPDDAAILAILTAVARAANDAATLEEAASVAIRQVCAHTGWPAGRLCQRDGDDLHATDVRWVSSPQWYQHWADPSEALSSTSGATLGGRVTTIAVASPEADRRRYAPGPGEPRACFDGPSSEPVASLGIPVLVGSEVVAVLEFLVDRTVQPDDVLGESLATVGIQLGRVFERHRTQAVLRQLQEADASGSTP